MPMRAPRCSGSAAIASVALARCLYQQVVDHAFVLIGDVAQLSRQRVDDMEVADWQQLGFALCKPRACRGALTLGAMPVAAGIVGDERVAAGLVLAARDMAAERRRAAALDGAHHLHLVEADVAAVGFTPSGTVVAEDVRNLQSWTAHAGGALCRRLGLAPSQSLAWLRQQVERALDGRDQARGNARVARGRIELGMAK